MIIRPSRIEDIEKIDEIYNAAKQALREQGVNQWQDGYPNAESARKDICEGISYVLEHQGAIVGTAVIAFGIEPTYNEIFEGTWRNANEPYGFIHRIAIDPSQKGKGLASIFFRELHRRAGEKSVHSLRIDTHPDNLSMQRALAKYGFEFRGKIYLENGDLRLAYEKIQ